MRRIFGIAVLAIYTKLSTWLINSVQMETRLLLGHSPTARLRWSSKRNSRFSKLFRKRCIALSNRQELLRLVD